MATTGTGTSSIRNLAGAGKILKGSVSLTLDDVTAGSESTITITDTRIESGDQFIGCDAGAEVGAGTLAILKGWVSGDSTLKITVGNVHASTAFSSEAVTFDYLVYSESTNNEA